MVQDHRKEWWNLLVLPVAVLLRTVSQPFM
jgi:hypothetical protein